MALETAQIQDKLSETFSDSLFLFKQERDILSVEVPADKISAIILFLKNDPELRFQFLN